MSAAGPTEAETGVPPGEPLTSTVHNVHTASAVIDPPISASVGAHSENAEKAGSIHGSISDEDDDDLGKDFEGGTKLRDLSGSEATQFPGIKREHWWWVARGTGGRRADVSQANMATKAFASTSARHTRRSGRHTSGLRFADQHLDLQCECTV